MVRAARRRFTRPLTANEQLLDRAVRHAVFLEQLKNGLSNDALELLENLVFQRILDRAASSLARVAARGHDVTLASRAVLRDLEAAVATLTREGYAAALEQLDGRLVDIARMEADFQLARLQEATSPVRLEFARPSPVLLRAISRTRPFNGAHLRDWYRGLEEGTRTRVRRSLQEGLRLGETVDQMVRRLRGTRANRFRDGVLQTSRRSAEMVVRTATNHVVTSAREITYDANRRLLKGVQYVATLDDRTTIICANLDGQVFPVNEGPRPPMHPNCRSTTAPVLRSARDLGLPGREVTPSTRASLDGQVPETLRYPEWLAGQSEELQRRVLGTARFELFQQGVPMSRFVNRRHRVLTLEELGRLEGI